MQRLCVSSRNRLVAVHRRRSRVVGRAEIPFVCRRLGRKVLAPRAEQVAQAETLIRVMEKAIRHLVFGQLVPHRRARIEDAVFDIGLNDGLGEERHRRTEFPGGGDNLDVRYRSFGRRSGGEAVEFGVRADQMA